MDVNNTSPELVMMEPHSNVYDDRPNNNDSLDGAILMDATKEASVENPGSWQGSQVGWTIYSGYPEPLPGPMIPPYSSCISPTRMSVSTFTQGGTPKPLVLTLGMSKQQPLSLYRESPMPFTYQDGASDDVNPPSESMHGRGNHGKETENLTASTARKLFKAKSKSHSPASMAVEGTFVIASDTARAVELYGYKKEAGEEGEKSLSPEDVYMSLERGDRGLSTRARGNEYPGRRRSMARSKDR